MRRVEIPSHRFKKLYLPIYLLFKITPNFCFKLILFNVAPWDMGA